MIVLALKNLRLRSAGTITEVYAGQTIDLPPDQVDSLLAKAPDKIRVIQPGFIVTWHSPLIGVCSGQVSEVQVAVIVITEHGVTKERTNIPSAWITKIEEAVG
ncbi:MAG: hypothetical protein O3B41_12010 [Bacteroidetes bacterium]|nr:hypothetical protein [Bacteroidota bacterium]